MTIRPLILHAAKLAADYIDELPTKKLRPEASVNELRRRLGGPLPSEGISDEQVLSDLVTNASDGLLHTASSRFFGWVIGGTLPAALAADMMTSAWDQNAGAHDCSPSSAIIEEICGTWLKELFGLPREASFAFVSGCQMAHVTALAAARHRLYTKLDWDVGTKGLIGAPAIRVLSSANHHETFARALRLLGLGTDCIEIVDCDSDGRIEPAALQEAFQSHPDSQTILCLQAGDLNTGQFDDFATLCDIAHEHQAWVHVDGAFGLWAQLSPQHKHLLSGIDKADSWATDGHKWLNVPYDSGYVFVRDADAHRASMTMDASYVAQSSDRGIRNQFDWGPQWSRRDRAIPTYAAIRALGREGISEMITRSCVMATLLVEKLGELEGVEVIARPRINQGLVRFLDSEGNHDKRTDEVIDA
ncbi:MAG: aspartate aminotransferase family protein, partial [Kofleriaceae bacterium]|nr:aspartate aminotransferase family protein [Kofleriaceae bacterium]